MSQAHPPAYAIGIMSGTSADGIDGVVLEIGDSGSFQIVETCAVDYPDHIRSKVRDIARRRIGSAEESDNLDMELAHLFAAAAEKLIEQLGHREIAVVGSHGQTVNHSPDSDPAFTVQLGNGPKIASLLELPVVSNFREADMEAGGQGAPLAPGFHQAAFSDENESRVVINIGGISNITFLPRQNGEVTGFDTGPGNTLLDYWCRTHFDCEYDDNGNIAREGDLQLDLLDLLLKDPYFAQLPPKSTGLEYFNEKWLKDKMLYWEGYGHASNQDILMTLTYLTARAIADQVNLLQPAVDHAYVCGGGARNSLLMEILNDKARPVVSKTDEIGIDPKWVEASAFAWMAHRTLNGLTSTLPSVTGAGFPTVAGVVNIP